MPVLVEHVVPKKQSESRAYILIAIFLTSARRSYDLDLPVEVDDEYWENKNPKLAFQQPSKKPALVAAFNSLIQLTRVVSIALRTIVGRCSFTIAAESDYYGSTLLIKPNCG